MADWKQFYDYWSANFRQLNVGDGLSEWQKFVTDQRTDLALLREALEPFAERYAHAVENMENPKMPTLMLVRSLYFRRVRERQQNVMRSRYGETTCGICGGTGWLLVLSPSPDDLEKRHSWPEDYRVCRLELLGAVEMTPCTQCRRISGYTPELKRRIERNGVPLLVHRGHPSYPCNAEPDEMPGSDVLQWRLRKARH